MRAYISAISRLHRRNQSGCSFPHQSDRSELDGLDACSDALLLINAFERHNVTNLPALDTDTLVNIYIYTLLSDVQRDANDFR